MKPDWDKLMTSWNAGENSESSLIADVDCTAAGKALCDEVGVKGFPTIKWGDPSALEDYKGGRDYAALESFAKENLKSLCSPTNLHLCDENKKQEISALQSMSDADLSAKIEEKKAKITQAEETFASEVKKLQSRYDELKKEKDAKLAEIKDRGHGLMQAVQAHAKKSAKAEEL